MPEARKRPGAYCDFPGCTFRVRATQLALVFDELLKHEEQTGHDRKQYGHMTGM